MFITADCKLGTLGACARAWFDLIRIFKVPIPLCGVLAGAFAASPSINVGMWGLLIVAATLGCAATEAFSDYEDRESDARNSSIRPLPSGRLSARSVLIGGHLFTIIWAILSAVVEPLAALVVLAVYALTRYYSRLKRVSLIRHALLPVARGLMPVYGSLMVAHEVFPLSILAGISICLIDINMNIVGTFKDLWDGSTHERVLPVVIGARPAVSIALFTGVAGAFVQGAAVPLGLCGSGIWLPLGVGMALTLQSRLALHRYSKCQSRLRGVGVGTVDRVFNLSCRSGWTPPLVGGACDNWRVDVLRALRATNHTGSQIPGRRSGHSDFLRTRHPLCATSPSFAVQRFFCPGMS